jgi:hypothetical protein
LYITTVHFRWRTRLDIRYKVTAIDSRAGSKALNGGGG